MDKGKKQLQVVLTLENYQEVMERVRRIGELVDEINKQNFGLSRLAEKYGLEEKSPCE